MKLSRRILIALSGAGLVLLGACSSGQQAANPGTSSSSDSMSKMEPSSSNQEGQRIAPVTQTGEARMSLNVAANPLAQGKNMLMLTVMDAKGQPVTAKEVQVAMMMTAKEMDAMGMKGMGEGSAKTQVKPGTSPGVYEIETSFPFHGNWELKVELKDAQSPASAVFNVAVK